MGDHYIGREMGRAAEHAVATRKPGETALDILDRICKPHKGRDAEFESEDPDNRGCVHPEYDRYTDPHPKAALGMLMLEAFAPAGIASLPVYAAMLEPDEDDEGQEKEEAACDAWWEQVYDPFKARYGFC